MEYVGGSNALLTLGSVITAVGYDGCKLIVEVVFCLVRPKEVMSMES